MTEAGADFLARRHGFRFVGFVAPGSLGDDTPAPDRWLARFDALAGAESVLCDGRTKVRALVRGVEACRQVAAGAARTRPVDAP